MCFNPILLFESEKETLIQGQSELCQRRCAQHHVPVFVALEDCANATAQCSNGIYNN